MRPFVRAEGDENTDNTDNTGEDQSEGNSTTEDGDGTDSASFDTLDDNNPQFNFKDFDWTFGLLESIPGIKYLLKISAPVELF